MCLLRMRVISVLFNALGTLQHYSQSLGLHGFTAVPFTIPSRPSRLYREEQAHGCEITKPLAIWHLERSFRVRGTGTPVKRLQILHTISLLVLPDYVVLLFLDAKCKQKHICWCLLLGAKYRLLKLSISRQKKPCH